MAARGFSRQRPPIGRPVEGPAGNRKRAGRAAHGRVGRMVVMVSHLCDRRCQVLRRRHAAVQRGCYESITTPNPHEIPRTSRWLPKREGRPHGPATSSSGSLRGVEAVVRWGHNCLENFQVRAGRAAWQKLTGCLHRGLCLIQHNPQSRRHRVVMDNITTPNSPYSV
jgi:hypothetical protein